MKLLLEKPVLILLGSGLLVLSSTLAYVEHRTELEHPQATASWTPSIQPSSMQPTASPTRPASREPISTQTAAASESMATEPIPSFPISTPNPSLPIPTLTLPPIQTPVSLPSLPLPTPMASCKLLCLPIDVCIPVPPPHCD